MSHIAQSCVTRHSDNVRFWRFETTSCSPNEDFGRTDKRWNPDFRLTFQLFVAQIEYSSSHQDWQHDDVSIQLNFESQDGDSMTMCISLQCLSNSLWRFELSRITFLSKSKHDGMIECLLQQALMETELARLSHAWVGKPNNDDGMLHDAIIMWCHWCLNVRATCNYGMCDE